MQINGEDDVIVNDQSGKASMLGLCERQRGHADRCLICPLQVEICERVMAKFSGLRKQLQNTRINGIDREEILGETLDGVILAVKKTMDVEEPDTLTVPGISGNYIHRIFKNKLSDYYRNRKERFGEWSEMVLPFIPSGLAAIIEEHSAHLRLRGSTLFAQLLPDTARKSLMNLAIWCPEWRQAIGKLAKWSWQLELDSLTDAEGNAVDIADESSSPESRAEEKEQQRSGRKSNQSSLARRIWQDSKSKGAPRCLEWLDAHGNVFFGRASTRRKDLAVSLGMEANTVTKIISRCRKLFWQALIKASPDAACRELFIVLHNPSKNNRSKSFGQRSASLAMERGVVIDQIWREYGRCGDMAVKRLSA